MQNALTILLPKRSRRLLRTISLQRRLSASARSEVRFPSLRDCRANVVVCIFPFLVLLSQPDLFDRPHSKPTVTRLSLTGKHRAVAVATRGASHRPTHHHHPRHFLVVLPTLELPLGPTFGSAQLAASVSYATHTHLILAQSPSCSQTWSFTSPSSQRRPVPHSPHTYSLELQPGSLSLYGKNLRKTQLPRVRDPLPLKDTASATEPRHSCAAYSKSLPVHPEESELLCLRRTTFSMEPAPAIA